MSIGHPFSSRLPEAYTAAGPASFSEVLGALSPESMPAARAGSPEPTPPLLPHGTTIVALTFDGGVVMAGDRRATTGNVISSRTIRKVFAADTHSVVGIAGTAGIATEIVRLFSVELEHYEKVEGTRLSLDGKSNRLAAMIKANLPMAMQGLAAIPLFAGVEADAARPHGRIVSFDAAGARHEEYDYHSIGSGSVYAKSALKKRFRADIDADDAARLAVEALYDAADDDSATGGPDLTRQIFPVVMVVDADGVTELSESQAHDIARAVVDGRAVNPGG